MIANFLFHKRLGVTFDPDHEVVLKFLHGVAGNDDLVPNSLMVNHD